MGCKADGADDTIGVMRRISVVRRTAKREHCAMARTEHNFPFEGTGGVN